MRVSHRLSLGELGRGERGVSAIITAVALVGLVAGLLLTVDAGNVWQTRRHIITATDAAALREAEIAAIEGPSQACTSWEALLLENGDSGTTPIDCTVVADPGGNTGWVTVSARKAYAVHFGGIFGIGDRTAYSLSAAQWGYITQTEGLRPIGICLQDTHVQSWINGTPDLGVHPSAGVHRIYYTKGQPDDCGLRDPVGNWGFVDPEGRSASNGDMRQWMLTGYPELVGTGDCNADGVMGDPCDPFPGSRANSIEGALQELVEAGQTGGSFTIIIFDSASGVGRTTRYNVYAFLGVILHGFQITGREEERYLDLEFVRITRPGNCCVPTGVNTGVLGVRLCAVDHDSQPEAARCSLNGG